MYVIQKLGLVLYLRMKKKKKRGTLTIKKRKIIIKIGGTFKLKKIKNVLRLGYMCISEELSFLVVVKLIVET